MFDDENNVPRLRFPGYTDVWEKRKLGDVAEIIGGATPSTSEADYWNGDIDWYSPAEIGDQIYVSNSQKKITELGLQKSSAKLLPVGTILFTSRAGIGNTAIVAKEASTNQGFQSIVPKKEELNSYFIFSMTDRLKRYGEVTGAGSIFVEVSGKQMAQMVISLPGVEEQYEIGQLFQKLDNLITVNQREGQKLKDLKEAYLQKMFPRAGENVPELRFPGFTDVWEKRTLGEISDFFDFQRVPVEYGERKNGQYPYYGATGIVDYIDEYIFEGEYVLLAEDGANITMRTNPIAYKTRGKFWLNNHAHIMKAHGDAEFLKQSLERITYLRYNSGTAQPKLNAKTVQGIEFLVPTPVEQLKIGKLFEKIDDLISVNQREAQKLQDLKQAYLKDMFV